MEYKLIYTKGTEEIIEIYYSEEEYINALIRLQSKINIEGTLYSFIQSISGSI